MEEPVQEPLPVRIKYYTTLTLGVTSILSVFIFLFLVPFVLDPSISTLMANFDPEPVVCKTVQSDHQLGMKNCSWSSCKHGCTTDQYECDQIYVNYMHVPFSTYDEIEDGDEENKWIGRGVPVFVNIKACGYPPHTNCTEFGEIFGPLGAIFPCYYSRADPDLVITEYSWESAVNPLIIALIVPNLITGISLAVLSYWYYPGCQRRPNQYQLPPDQEDASSQQGEDDEDDDDDDEDEDEDEDGSHGDKESQSGGEGDSTLSTANSNNEDERDKDEAESRRGGGHEISKKNRPQEEEKDRDTCITIPEEKV